MTLFSSHLKQQGSVLMWGLVILLVMTVLGVVGAKMATTDINIAGNEIFRTLSYQAAESTIERSTDLFYQNRAAELKGEKELVGKFEDRAMEGTVNSDATIMMSKKVSCNMLNDLAMSTSMKADDYECRLFDIEVNARVAGTGAKSTHALGVMRFTPASANNN
ncbi:pilus assembly PilX family protein [Thiofilum flexile]|uniref:pilus assembly PilX family protein n=1 Tax=Thiofilum flexile TaxID=125627 RepID=UPI00036D095B|nr:PilX N-terminal domain-containing pilus assembly protein [Thiofilum flexile]